MNLTLSQPSDGRPIALGDSEGGPATERHCLDALQDLMIRGTDRLVGPEHRIDGRSRRLVGPFEGFAWGYQLTVDELLDDLDAIEDAVMRRQVSRQQGATEARDRVHAAVAELRHGNVIRRRFFRSIRVPAAAELGSYCANARRLARDLADLCDRCGAEPRPAAIHVVARLDE